MITLITTVSNDLKNLKNTIKSLEKQNYKEWRHIIVDNNSTDINRNWKYLLDKRVVYIKKKCSLYQGMNIGINYVKSDYFLIINAGTVFTSIDVLSDILEHIKKNKNQNLYITKCKTNDNRIYETKKIRNLFYPASLNHEALIYKSFTNIRHQEYYGMAADVNFIFEYLRKGNISTADNICSIIYERGGSSDRYPFIQKSIDHIKISKTLLFSGWIFSSVWYFIRAMKDLYRHFCKRTQL